MTSMDVFLVLTLNRKMFNLSLYGAQRLIEAETGVIISEQDANLIIKYPPKTKQLIHALSDKGFSPAFIQGYLGMSQSNISYHMNTTGKTEYVNPVWRSLQQQYEPKS